MNLISSLASNIRALTMEDPAQPLQPYSVLMDMLGMTITDSGMLVNEKTAMRQPTVLACVRSLAQGLSSLPLNVFQRLPKGKKPSPDHKLAPLLRDSPNEQMSAMTWRMGQEAQRQLWGNCYSEIQRDRAGRVVALWPLPSDRTNPERKNGRLQYVTTATPDGGRRYIAPRNVLHVPHIAFDGLVGISPVQLGKQTIGRAMAMDRFGAQLFGNGVRPSGVFVIPGELGTEARENLRQTLQSSASGQNALRPMLLENGLKWEKVSYPPNEAQMVEAMKEIIADIARLFGVPLHLVQEMSRATNNNIEQQALEFVMYSLRPSAILHEQELNRKLFAGTDYFCEHGMEGLLRGDFQTRMEGYLKLFQTGSVSPNMIAGNEGWNPIPAAEGGDMRFVQLNMIPLELAARNLDEESQPAPAPGGGNNVPDDPNDPAQNLGENTPGDPNASLRRERVIKACARIFLDAVNRTISRAVRDQETVRRIWQAPVEVMAELVGMFGPGGEGLNGDCAKFAASYAADVWSRASAWEKPKAGEISQQELEQAYATLCQKILGRSPVAGH